MKSTQTVLQRWLGAFTVAAILSGCQSGSENTPATDVDELVQNLSGRFSASLTSDNEVTVRYEAPDGVGLSNVDVCAVPVWYLQSVVDGMNNSQSRGADVHWDSLSPGESRTIDFGEPPQLNDGVTSVKIEGTAELQGSPVRFAVEQRR